MGISGSIGLLLQREAWELLGSLVKQRIKKATSHDVFHRFMRLMFMRALGLDWQFAFRAEFFLR